MNCRAAAVTPSLHVGNEAPFPHLVASSVDGALSAIDAGLYVLVASGDLALEVLVASGADPDVAAEQVHRALHGLERCPTPDEPATPKEPRC